MNVYVNHGWYAGVGSESMQVDKRVVPLLSLPDVSGFDSYCNWAPIYGMSFNPTGQRGSLCVRC